MVDVPVIAKVTAPVHGVQVVKIGAPGAARPGATAGEARDPGLFRRLPPPRTIEYCAQVGWIEITRCVSMVTSGLGGGRAGPSLTAVSGIIIESNDS